MLQLLYKLEKRVAQHFSIKKWRSRSLRQRIPTYLGIHHYLPELTDKPGGKPTGVLDISAYNM